MVKVEVNTREHFSVFGHIPKLFIVDNPWFSGYWFAWYMRRLAERPANALFLLRNLFGWARGRYAELLQKLHSPGSGL